MNHVERIEPLRALMFAACVAATPYGCAAPFKVAPGYEMAEIPYSASTVVWLDNDSVLFTGVRRTSQDETIRGAIWGSPALYRWNTRTGDVTEQMKTGDYADLCHDRGYIYVAFNKGDTRVTREGRLEKEKQIVFDKNTNPVKGELNRYSCRWQEGPKPSTPGFAVSTVLRDDHGFIEVERPSKPFQQRYFLVRPSGERIQIQLPCGAGGPRFSEYRQAYVYQDGRGRASPAVGRMTCVVGTDGMVTTYKFPSGNWMRGTIYGMPVRHSILMISRSTLAKAEGAYLVKDDQVERIVEANVQEFAVSPNGCRIALSAQPEDGVVAHVGVIRICKGQN
jgi:hypothetical protein